MRNLPSVTCGFTLYNCEDTIIRAINSSLRQKYPNKQLLLVDDCSTDNTAKVVKAILRNSNIQTHLISLENNMGVAYARNVLIENCKTDYIAFFDDDDESHPMRLMSQINHLENYKSQKNNKATETLCYTKRLMIKSSKTSIIQSMEVDLSVVNSYDVIAALLSAKPLPRSCNAGSTATCTLCSRVKTLKRIGNFDIKFRRFEDLDLAIKGLNCGVSLTTVQNCLVNQFFTDTVDKSNAYKYNLVLLEKYREVFQNQKEYRYALLFVRLKNRIIHTSNESLIFIALTLIIKHPIKLLKHLTVIISQKIYNIFKS